MKYESKHIHKGFEKIFSLLSGYKFLQEKGKALQYLQLYLT